MIKSFGDESPSSSSPLRLSDLLARFSEVVQERKDYVVPCPAHADGRPSLVLGVNAGGKLLVHCRAGCDKAAVLDALRPLGVTQLHGWEAGDAVTTSASTSEELVSGVAITQLRTFLGQAAERYDDSPASFYASERFGITEALAHELGLGYHEGASSFTSLSRRFTAVPRLVVPFRGFDGIARGVQGRALGPHETKWCGPVNPDGSHWARVAVFATGTGLDTIVLTEGPGDALTAAGAGYDAAAVRGAALGGSVAEELLQGLQGRRVVIFGDNDPAGDSFRLKLGDLLTEAGIQTLQAYVPEPHNDLTEWREKDPDAFSQAIGSTIRVAEPHRAETPAPAPAPRRVVMDDDYEHTDLGNAERLRDALGGLVRFSPEGGFYLWDGSCWVLDRYDLVRTHAQDVARQMADDGEILMRDPATKEEGVKLAKWGRRSQSTRSLDSMVKELGALRDVAVDIEQMDGRHDLLAFRNGTVDLRTGELLPHDPRHLITRRMDLDYDPEAPCARWTEFLEEVFSAHPDLVEYIQTLVGYGITGETGEQCFAILLGRGANGKSVLTDTLTDVFRSITVTTPFATFEAKPNGGIPNDLAAMKGARLVMASEGEAGKGMSESTIKRLTGGDYISARFMRREFFEFRPTFLILMATNHRPRFRGQDEGLWRRVKLIPFDRFFAPHERDPFLSDKLKSEAQGIAAWAVRGAVRWYDRGLQDPPTIVDLVADFRQNSDKLYGFFPGALVADPSHREWGSDVYRAYETWLGEEGLSERELWTRSNLYQALEERGVVQTRGKKGVQLLGVRLVGVAPQGPPADERSHSNTSGLAALIKETPTG